MTNSNWPIAPRIEKVSSETTLLEQIEGVYWPPFECQQLHSYDLSGWHLQFCGNAEEDSYGVMGYAGYSTDIHEEKNYPQYQGISQRWDKSDSYIWLHVAECFSHAYVELGDDEFINVGRINFDIRMIKFRNINESSVGDNVKDNILLRHQKIEKSMECDVWFGPKSTEDISAITLNGQRWYKVIDGNKKFNWHFTFYLPLDPNHYLMVRYTPSEFWPAMHDPSEKALQVTLMPLWDFMGNLSMTAPGEEAVTRIDLSGGEGQVELNSKNDELSDYEW